MSGRRPVPWWLAAVVALALVVAANVAGWAYSRAQTASRLLPGIEVVREPGEVRALALDGDTLYAGGRDGLFALDTRSMEVTRPVGVADLAMGQVRGLVLDADRTLWIAHERGLTRLRDGRARTYSTADGLPSDRVQCLLRARDGRLWVGTFRGAAVMDGESFDPLTTADGLLDDMVNAIAEDRDGGLWFGSYVAPRGGVSVLRDGSWHTFTLDDGLPHADVTCFLLAADGGMWAGTGFHDRGGAVRFEVPAQGAPRIAETLSAADGLAGEKVRSMWQDAEGHIWFGSESDGIAVRTPAGFRLLTTAEGMSDNEAKAILPDGDGRVWLGTRNGITLVRDPRVVTGR